MSSPFRRYGGKSKLARRIVSLIPPHRVYVEPFCGAAHVLFAKPASETEVIADLDPHLIGLWRTAADPELAAAVAHRVREMPNTKEAYEVCREQFAECTDRVEKIASYFVLTQRSINGAFGIGWSRPSRPADERADSNRLNRLVNAHTRLANVSIQCDDFRTLLPRYNAAEVFLLCDPPYTLGTRRAKSRYLHEMSDADHESLLDLLKRHEGAVMLCGYANPLYDDMLRGWVRLDYKVAKHAASGTTKGKAIESLWLNRLCWAAVSDQAAAQHAWLVAA